MDMWRSYRDAVRNWYNDIFNYFDYPYTNAITESINNLIKSIEKAGLNGMTATSICHISTLWKKRNLYAAQCQTVPN